jgi:hypothetical protein
MMSAAKTAASVKASPAVTSAVKPAMATMACVMRTASVPVMRGMVLTRIRAAGISGPAEPVKPAADVIAAVAASCLSAPCEAHGHHQHGDRRNETKEDE